jgi:hypothetical protein
MTLLTFKTRWRNESHQWSSDGEVITSPAKLDAIRKIFETSGPMVVEHRIYCGGGRPEHMVFQEVEEFLEYLRQHAFAGDSIHVWDLGTLLRDEDRLVFGKCPAEDGTVPKGGAY